jgi:hypothetical protein
MTSNCLDRLHLEVRSDFQGVASGTLGSAIRLPGSPGVPHESPGSAIRLPVVFAWWLHI